MKKIKLISLAVAFVTVLTVLFGCGDISTVEYTKGTFDGTTYVNEWADIKLTLPSGFSNADSDMYSSAEDEVTDCGVYLTADDATGCIIISYEKLPLSIYDEKDYLDSTKKLILENQVGITYEVVDGYSTTDIAGYSYLAMKADFNNAYGDFAQTIYVRKLDKYMIGIVVIGTSIASNDALVNNITTVD